MLFHSITYLFLFLPLVAAIAGLLRAHFSARWPQSWLLLASLFFYTYAKPSNLILLLGSISFNWGIARWMMAQPAGIARKRVFVLGLVGNIGFLCTFKYANFLLRSVAFIPQLRFTLPDWSFPLGLSFFTLTQIMYLVDTYQGLNEASSWFDHATLVSLFPYVISGPLVRARSVLPQFKKAGPYAEMACRGVFLLSMGLAKKVILADSFAAIANAGFGSSQPYSTLEAWAFSLAFTFQLYFDFSGYSDMALGSAWILGVDIPQNFNAPFRSKSITEFWQRWHISLSNFITNYLYTPILRAMPRVTLSASVFATLLAMTIAGLWHGPAWTFVVFGLLHGIGLALNQVWKKKKMRMPDWCGWLLTFAFVNVTLVFFRSPDFASALHMLYAMLPHANLLGTAGLKGLVPLSPAILLRPVAVGVIVAFLFKSSAEWSKSFRPTALSACAAAALILISLFFMNSAPAKQFVYFAF